MLEMRRMPRRARTEARRQPRQQRGEATIAVLLEATERVLSRDGFHGATTNEIAKVAGVSIGTLYHYFPTKEALVAAVVHRMWEAELTAVMAHAGAFVTEPLPEAILRAVTALVDEVKKKMPLYRSWYTEASHLGELERGLSMTGTAVDFIKEVLERRRDEVRVNDIPFAADFVVKTALAIARTGARDYEKEMLDGHLSRELAEMLTRYLVK